MIEPNTLLQNRYQVIRKLGQGGMGAVYLATDQRFGSTVALKQTLVQGETFHKAFEREAKLLNNLKHAALPHVIDYFREGAGEFLVMEFIPGDDLGSKLHAQNQPFHVGDVLQWADQLLDLLDYLHSHEPPIIHRDIKPENLKVTPRGTIILLDFGLAKGSSEAMQVTRSSIVGYTPSYAPLEQIRGTGTDARSDLYALGATLYHLLTNRLPPDALMRADAIVNGQPDPMRPANELNPLVPAPVAAVLHAAMALRTNDRPSSASAMRMALKQSVMNDQATILTGGSAALGGLSGPSNYPGTSPQGFGPGTIPQGYSSGTAPQSFPPWTAPQGFQQGTSPQAPGPMPQGFGVAPPQGFGSTPSGDPTHPSGPRMIPPTVPAQMSVPPTTVEQPRRSQGAGIAVGLLGSAVFVLLGLVCVLVYFAFFNKSDTTVPAQSNQTANTQTQTTNAQSTNTRTDNAAKPENTNETATNTVQPPDNPPAGATGFTIAASSSRAPIGSNSYTPDKAVDGRTDTAWVEGGAGEGIGESLSLRFTGPSRIAALRILPGYFKSATVWGKNNRLADVTFELSDGRRIQKTFTDAMIEQPVEIGGGPVTSIRIVINRAYLGGDSLDTAISEIEIVPQ